jgi:hypothetical protein
MTSPPTEGYQVDADVEPLASPHASGKDMVGVEQSGAVTKAPFAIAVSAKFREQVFVFDDHWAPWSFSHGEGLGAKQRLRTPGESDKQTDRVRFSGSGLDYPWFWSRA